MVLHGFTGSSTGVLLYKFYTVLLGVLQGFYYRGPTRFYWALYRGPYHKGSAQFHLQFYRGSIIRVLHDFTGRSTGVLLWKFYRRFTIRVLPGFTGSSTGVRL